MRNRAVQWLLDAYVGLLSAPSAVPRHSSPSTSTVDAPPLGRRGASFGTGSSSILNMLLPACGLCKRDRYPRPCCAFPLLSLFCCASATAQHVIFRCAVHQDLNNYPLTAARSNGNYTALRTCMDGPEHLHASYEAQSAREDVYLHVAVAEILRGNACGNKERRGNSMSLRCIDTRPDLAQI